MISHRIVEFENKIEKEIQLENMIIPEIGQKMMWVDICYDEGEDDAVLDFLDKIRKFSESAKNDLLRNDPISYITNYDNMMMFTVSTCWLNDKKEFDVEYLNCIIDQRFLLTIHKGKNRTLDKIKNKGYVTGLINFSGNPSFIIYEIFHHTIRNFMYIQDYYEEKIKSIEGEILKAEGIDVLKEAFILHSAIKDFRSMILPSRLILSHLVHKNTLFISDSTKPILLSMIETTERILSDLIDDRNIFFDSVNFHMTVINYRLQDVMRKMTGAMVIFLPLGVLTSIYGMNFPQPEYEWKHGYMAFWAAFVMVTFISVYAAKKMKLV